MRRISLFVSCLRAFSISSSPKSQRALYLLVFLVIVRTCIACTSTTYADLSSEQLHEKIAAGEIVKPGETATIVTVDGQKRELQVTAVGDDNIDGTVVASRDNKEDEFGVEQGVEFDYVRIPITDIQSVEKVQVSHPAGQATIAAGVGIGTMFLLMLPGAIVAALAL